MLDQIGGDLKGQRILRMLSNLNADVFKSRAYILNGPKVDNHLMPSGQRRVLNEGESFSFQMPMPEADALLKQLAKDSDSIYIFDTIGRKHRVPRRVLKKLRRDYKNRLKR